MWSELGGMIQWSEAAGAVLLENTPVHVFSIWFREFFKNTYFLEHLRTTASVFSLTKVEDCNLHAYHFTIRDSTTTAEILANNFRSCNKGTFWKKSLDDFVQPVVD